MPYLSGALKARSRRGYGWAVIGLAITLLAVAAPITLRGGSRPGDRASVLTGAFRVAPTGLAVLVSNSSTVVMGQVIGGPTVETVSVGQSSPLGEKQTVHDVTLDIATYEVRVDRCVAGAPCQPVVKFKEAVDHENPELVNGTRMLLFASPAIAKWGAPGLASYYGREGVLVARGDAAIALVPGGGAAAQFLARQSLDDVAARVAAMASGTR